MKIVGYYELKADSPWWMEAGLYYLMDDGWYWKDKGKKITCNKMFLQKNKWFKEIAYWKTLLNNL